MDCLTLSLSAENLTPAGSKEDPDGIREHPEVKRESSRLVHWDSGCARHFYRDGATPPCFFYLTSAGVGRLLRLSAVIYQCDLNVSHEGRFLAHCLHNIFLILLPSAQQM